jgi:hypothetical protein
MLRKLFTADQPRFLQQIHSYSCTKRVIVVNEERSNVVSHDIYAYMHTYVQNGSGSHPASYPVGTSGPFPGVKAVGA